MEGFPSAQPALLPFRRPPGSLSNADETRNRSSPSTAFIRRKEREPPSSGGPGSEPFSLIARFSPYRKPAGTAHPSSKRQSIWRFAFRMPKSYSFWPDSPPDALGPLSSRSRLRFFSFFSFFFRHVLHDIVWRTVQQRTDIIHDFQRNVIVAAHS